MSPQEQTTRVIESPEIIEFIEKFEKRRSPIFFQGVNVVITQDPMELIGLARVNTDEQEETPLKIYYNPAVEGGISIINSDETKTSPQLILNLPQTRNPISIDLTSLYSDLELQAIKALELKVNAYESKVKLKGTDCFALAVKYSATEPDKALEISSLNATQEVTIELAKGSRMNLNQPENSSVIPNVNISADRSTICKLNRLKADNLAINVNAQTMLTMTAVEAENSSVDAEASHVEIDGFTGTMGVKGVHSIVSLRRINGVITVYNQAGETIIDPGSISNRSLMLIKGPVAEVSPNSDANYADLIIKPNKKNNGLTQVEATPEGVVVVLRGYIKVKHAPYK